jgi:hypothetical protein
MKFIKYVGSAMILGFIIYNLVDDKARAIIDNGIEKQSIGLVETKKNIYLFFSELSGADEKEIAADTAAYDAEIKLRKEKLEEKIKTESSDRLPAKDEPKNYDHLISN